MAVWSLLGTGMLPSESTLRPSPQGPHFMTRKSHLGPEAKLGWGLGVSPDTASPPHWRCLEAQRMLAGAPPQPCPQAFRLVVEDIARPGLARGLGEQPGWGWQLVLGRGSGAPRSPTQERDWPHPARSLEAGEAPRSVGCGRSACPGALAGRGAAQASTCRPRAAGATWRVKRAVSLGPLCTVSWLVPGTRMGPSHREGLKLLPRRGQPSRASGPPWRSRHRQTPHACAEHGGLKAARVRWAQSQRGSGTPGR